MTCPLSYDRHYMNQYYYFETLRLEGVVSITRCLVERCVVLGTAELHMSSSKLTNCILSPVIKIHDCQRQQWIDPVVGPP